MNGAERLARRFLAIFLANVKYRAKRQWSLYRMWGHDRPEGTWQTVDGNPLCDICCVGDLTEEECPDDRGVCIWCCLCHRDEVFDEDTEISKQHFASTGVYLTRGETKAALGFEWDDEWHEVLHLINLEKDIQDSCGMAGIALAGGSVIARARRAQGWIPPQVEK